jgi:hypothetical protein
VTDPAVADVLADLLGWEQRNIVPLLLESGVFVSRGAVEDILVLRRIARWNQEHGQRLTQAILELGGVPEPRRRDASTADLHFQDVAFVLPRVESQLNRLMERYAQAAAHVSRNPRAAVLVREILDRHRKALEEVRELRRPMDASSPP